MSVLFHYGYVGKYVKIGQTPTLSDDLDDDVHSLEDSLEVSPRTPYSLSISFVFVFFIMATHTFEIFWIISNVFNNENEVSTENLYYVFLFLLALVPWLIVYKYMVMLIFKC